MIQFFFVNKTNHMHKSGHLLSEEIIGFFFFFPLTSFSKHFLKEITHYSGKTKLKNRHLAWEDKAELSLSQKVILRPTSSFG